jgi:hypothetical protein
MSFTVTATQSGTAITTGAGLLVEVLTNTATVQNGVSTTNQSSAAYSKAITTTVAGSFVYGGVGGSTATPVATASSTIVGTPVLQNAFWFGAVRSTSATGTPGSVTIGASNTYSNVGVGLFEVLANGTITIDGSSTAEVAVNGTAATTAAFTPPAGSLLVACVVTASAGATITDTSGLGLTWVLKNTGVYSNGFAGVFIAQMPSASLLSKPRYYNQAVKRAAFY